MASSRARRIFLPRVPLHTLRPDAPEELERLVTQLLAKDPAQRPASAGKVRDVLNEINDRHFGPHRPAVAGTLRTTSTSPRRKPPTDRSIPCGSPRTSPVPPAPPGQTRRRHGPARPARGKAGSSSSAPTGRHPRRHPGRPEGPAPRARQSWQVRRCARGYVRGRARPGLNCRPVFSQARWLCAIRQRSASNITVARLHRRLRVAPCLPCVVRPVVGEV